jgi:hypothetical protein
MFLAVLALSLALTVPAASKADAFKRAALTGRNHVTGSPYATAYNINAFATVIASTGVTVPGGSVSIVNNEGLVFLAAVASLTTDTVTVQGVNYKHAVVNSQSFLYQGAKVHAMIEITQMNPMAVIGYQIIRDSDSALMTASWPNGFYQQMPLEYGGSTIL